MHRRIKSEFHRIIRERGLRPQAALEVGGGLGANSLLRFPELEGAERVCLNLHRRPDRDGIRAVAGNANDMRMFRSGAFDLVMSNAMLEHDRRFWKSVAEMRRVLRPSGVLIIGVPGFDADPAHETGDATLTYKVHFEVDYYRFSEQAVREVFFEGLKDVEARSLLTPPRFVASGAA